MPLTPEQVASYGTAIVFGLGYGFERLRSMRLTKKHEESNEVITDAKKHAERAETMSKLADEYKTLFEREHADLAKYREEVHENLRKSTADSLKKDELILQLQAKPDLSDLFTHLEKSALRSTEDHSKILTALEQVMQAIKQLLDKHRS